MSKSCLLYSSCLVLFLSTVLRYSSLYSFHLILLLATGLRHSSPYSSCLVLLLATGLRHSLLYSSCLVLLLATVYVILHSTFLISSYSKQHVCIIFLCTLLISSYSWQHVPVIPTLLILIHLTLSNMSASFSLYASHLLLLLATGLNHPSLFSFCPV